MKIVDVGGNKMAVVNPIQALKIARENGFAIGAFNTNNMEFTQAILEAAKEMNSFVIVQTSESSIKYAGYKNLFSMVRNISDDLGLITSLHLDHGKYFSTVVNCIRHGWTSLMIDASDKPFNENVKITRRVVEFARAFGLQVEAEIGHVGGVEDYVKAKEFVTQPEVAKKFYDNTKVDSLAVAIGNAHGIYKHKPNLRFDILKEVAELISVPLVLHGGSGLPNTQVRKSIKFGISKVNIDTELRIAFKQGILEYIHENPQDINPRNILHFAKEKVKSKVKEKIKIFGSRDSLSLL